MKTDYAHCEEAEQFILLEENNYLSNWHSKPQPRPSQSTAKRLTLTITGDDGASQAYNLRYIEEREKYVL